MALAGQPFNTDPEAAARFMRAYAQAFSDGARFATQLVVSNQVARRGAEAPSPAPQSQALTEEQYLHTFQTQLLASLPQLSEHDRNKMCQGIASETLDGWSMLSEREKDIMRAIFLPPAEVETEQELPSNESAQKVVAAMRNGTLGPNTLAPPEPVKATKDLTPGDAVAASPGVQAKEALPAEPPPTTDVVHGAGSNGTETSSTNL
jgi:hypothetical protein